MQLYSEILDAGGPAFGAILRHVRDSPNDAFIFHCTGVFSAPRDRLLLKVHPAGKDRTGIAAALLLLVRPSPYLHRLRLNKFPPARRRLDRRNFSRLCANSYRSCPNTSPHFVAPCARAIVCLRSNSCSQYAILTVRAMLPACSG
jgi:hypothetical protein